MCPICSWVNDPFSVDESLGFPDSTSSASMMDTVWCWCVPEVGRGADFCPQRIPIVGEDGGRAEPPQDTRVW